MDFLEFPLCRQAGGFIERLSDGARPDFQIFALKIIIRMRKVVHLYQLLIFGIMDFRSLHLRHFLDLDFSTFWNHLSARREIWRILEIPDNCRPLFKGFSKAEAGLEMDLERFKGNLKEISSDPSRPTAGWLSNALHFLGFS